MLVLGGAERVLGFGREWGWMNWRVVGHPGSVGGVWCVGGLENVEWGVEDGDGWRLLCGAVVWEQVMLLVMVRWL